MAHESPEAYFAEAQGIGCIFLLFRIFFTTGFPGNEGKNAWYGNKIERGNPEFKDLHGKDLPKGFGSRNKERYCRKERAKTDEHKIGLDEEDQQKSNKNDQQKKGHSFFM